MDITLAGGAIAYSPSDDELAGVSLEFAAFDGEVGNGLLPIPDPLAGITVASGRAAVAEEGTTLLTDGFIIDQDRVRGPQPAGTAREHTFGVQDANALLDGFRVTRSRIAETDVARVLAFAALDGPTWDTTWVLAASTVTLPAKRYDSDGGWSELITDLVEFTGKTLFLHDKAGGGRCLHYHPLTNGHTCGLSISDVAGAQDLVTVFAPHEPARNRTAVDLRNDIKGRDQSGRTSTAIDATSIAAHDADGLRHQAMEDFEATSQADLDVKTVARLASLKDERDTYTCAIGPLDEAALALIRVGDLISVTSSVMGLTASVQRIAHMTLTVFIGNNGRARPGLWMAALELGAPVRRRRGIKPSLAGTVFDPTNPPPAVLPFVASGSAGQIIIAGDAGKLSSSDDGIIFTARTSGFGATGITAAEWSPELSLFVIGGGIKIATSPDGITWTLRTSGFSISGISGIAWSPELALFVAVNNATNVATSPDGIIWTVGANSGVQSLGIAWSPSLGLFVTCGGGGALGYSANGTTWTAFSVGSTDLRGIAWSPALGVFLAAGAGGGFRRSSDAVNWSQYDFDFPSPLDTVQFLGVEWSPALGLFVVVPGAANELITSPDGVSEATWTNRTCGFSSPVFATWSPGLSLFVVGGSTGNIRTSSDAITWTARTSGFGTDIVRAGAAASGAPLAPVRGMTVRELVGTGDGVTTAYTTDYPYLGGSLEVYVNNLREFAITETTPTTGAFTFSSAPFNGEVIRVEYQAS